MDNITMEVHKDFLRTGDTVLINNQECTVGNSDIRADPFMGTLIKGSAYPFVYKVVLYPRWDKGKFMGYVRG
jgi:hypothetical protein